MHQFSPYLCTVAAAQQRSLISSSNYYYTKSSHIWKELQDHILGSDDQLLNQLHNDSNTNIVALKTVKTVKQWTGQEGYGVKASSMLNLSLFYSYTKIFTVFIKSRQQGDKTINLTSEFLQGRDFILAAS